ncbi:hypothetical protein I601_1746 [Nocardioides dokdonensis FR1436]|uniref:Lipoprotein n=1 Tax=Nocardioides dokdonensis FR1436 TaxID=1300347 RepID=A0A1A9GIP4_9ACTN|nr:hypothetical protein [Nocardioides dokdonensis]ANH38177.1 hypothetical protein I601_1746 [Nocardioides dokdonensis FR1436]
MRPLVLVAIVLALAVTAGCGDDSAGGEPSREGAVADLEALADDVMTTGGEVVEVLEATGLEVAGARGKGDYCQSTPRPGFTFALGGELAAGAAYDEQVATAREALLDAGWEVETEGEVTRTGDQEPEAWVNLVRDDWRLTLRRSGPEGSGALVFGLTGQDACIAIPDTTTRVPDDLEEVTLVEQ